VSAQPQHPKDSPKCARREGYQVFALTVTYPRHRTRQFSVHRERVAEVRRWLVNYQNSGSGRGRLRTQP